MGKQYKAEEAAHGNHLLISLPRLRLGLTGLNHPLLLSVTIAVFIGRLLFHSDSGKILVSFVSFCYTFTIVKQTTNRVSCVVYS